MSSDLPFALAAFVLASAFVMVVLTAATSAALGYASRKYGISENEFLVGD